MSTVLGQHYGVSLPVPRFSHDPDSDLRIKKGKEFSVGLLENPASHKWYAAVKQLTKRQRLTVAGSLFLWRKTLPSKAASPTVHRMRVTAPERDLPPGYILHVVRQVEKMFPRGWDRKYLSLVDSAVPTVKSVLEQGRGKGGYRSTGPDREEYARRCIGDEDPLSSENAYKVRYMDAQCDGKVRAVTIMSSDAQVLKPLHKLLYDQISSFPWLLRGKAKPASFSSFKRVPGEVFLGGL